MKPSPPFLIPYSLGSRILTSDFRLRFHRLPMQQKNLIIFCLLSFLVLMVWMPLRYLLFPPVPPPPPPLKLPHEQLWAGFPAELMTMTPVGRESRGLVLRMVSEQGKAGRATAQTSASRSGKTQEARPAKACGKVCPR